MRVLLSVSLVVILGVGPAAAVESAKPAKQRQPSGDNALAISGLASSARHCVTSGAASVHSLGRVPEGTRVTVTFVSDFDPIAALTIVQLGSEAPNGEARASLVSDDDSGGNLEPEIRFTAPYGGTLALHVQPFGGEEAGCYQYKVEVRNP